MIKKILIISIASITFIFCLFFGIKFYTKYTIGYTKTYVASHQISQRKLITSEDLVEIEVPKDYLSDDLYLNADDIINKYVKLNHTIPKGSLFYKTSLQTDIKDKANTLLKDGEVNYDLYTNQVKINTANVDINMYVDIYLTINNKDKPLSDLLISNARITGLYDSDYKPILDYDKNNRVYVISIAVNNKDISILNKALLIGELNCVTTYNTYNCDLNTYLNNESVLFEYLE